MTKKRAKRPTDSSEYCALMVRLAKNLVPRAVDDGIDSLHSLAVISRMHEEVMAELVKFLRSEKGGSHSWAEIGDALGITRQSAQGRFGGEGARTTGGQPSHLR